MTTDAKPPYPQPANLQRKISEQANDVHKDTQRMQRDPQQTLETSLLVQTSQNGDEELEQNAKVILSTKARAEIDKWVAKYPADQKQSAVLSALHIVQEENGGWLSQQLLNAVADYLDMPAIAVYEVATFYSMYDLQPVGRHKINFCTNISCMLAGCNSIANHIKKRLGVEFGETTADGKFTLKEVECMAACAGAPMMQIDRTYYENLTPEKVDKILAELD